MGNGVLNAISFERGPWGGRGPGARAPRTSFTLRTPFKGNLVVSWSIKNLCKTNLFYTGFSSIMQPENVLSRVVTAGGFPHMIASKGGGSCHGFHKWHGWFPNMPLFLQFFAGKQQSSQALPQCPFYVCNAINHISIQVKNLMERVRISTLVRTLNMVTLRNNFIFFG